MGTTLTGTTPQDTYDSLIKVTDNGPIGTSLKTLTDGLGNDSALALSSRGLKVNQSATLITDTASLCHFSNNYLYLRGGSAGLSIGDDAFSNSITLADNADIAFEAGSAERMRITSAGNVGIGTSTPVAKLQTTGSDAASIITGLALENFIATNPSSGNGVAVDFRINNSGNASQVAGKISTVNTFFRSNTDMVFSTFTSDTLTEKVRIQSGGGISFNGDTAAANALDDYEEGTWTMGVSFGGGTTGITYSSNTGTYTKIGRQVTVNGLIALSSKGTDTGNALLTGLPFTIANGSGFYSAASLRIQNVSFANIISAIGSINTTNIAFQETTEAGVRTNLTNADFADNSEVMISFTYFV